MREEYAQVTNRVVCTHCGLAVHPINTANIDGVAVCTVCLTVAYKMHDTLVDAAKEAHEILGEYLLADSQDERDYLRGDLEHAQNRLFSALEAAGVE